MVVYIRIVTRKMSLYDELELIDFCFSRFILQGMNLPHRAIESSNTQRVPRNRNPAPQLIHLLASDNMTLEYICNSL